MQSHLHPQAGFYARGMHLAGWWIAGLSVATQNWPDSRAVVQA